MVDYGDLPVAPGDTAETYRRVEEALAPVAEAGVFPLAMGGDHSVTLAELRALASVHGPLALVQLDSHADMWEKYFGQRYLHGTTFRRAIEEGLVEAGSVVQAGLRGSLYGEDDLDASRELGFRVDPERRASGARPRRIRRGASGSGSATGPCSSPSTSTSSTPPSAPGTGTPEMAGLTTHEAMELLRSLRGLASSASTSSRSRRRTTAGPAHGAVAANVLWELLALGGTRARQTPDVICLRRRPVT